jgi:hypothetical protein
MAHRRYWLGLLLGACLPWAGLLAEPPEYAVKVADAKPVKIIDEILAKVPPLTHERGQRWPMILWEAGPFEPQPVAHYQALLARGLTQHIQMDAKHLEVAKAIQEAGSPVIMMQGQGGPWPGQLAGPREAWAHQFEGDYKPKGYARPCLPLHAGWVIQADRIREMMRQYRDAGVTVDAVWMDWEGDPMYGHDAYEQATHCKRCKELLDPQVLATREAFSRYSKRLTNDLLGTYQAAPVTEIFPRCQTTNWLTTISTPERPLRSWGDNLMLPAMPSSFTATNPVAYGNTVFWKKVWQAEWPLDREHVDQLYFHLLIRMVSDDQANAAKWAPQLKCFPWVDRWCPDDEDPKIPIMSRERYREVLRHLWLRGVDGMQVFQPRRPGYEEIVLSEILDAVAVYDEMLAFRDLLDGGEPLTYDYPPVQSDAVVWSGLRLGDQAVIRAFKQGGGEAEVEIPAWPDRKITLTAPATGATYRLTRTATEVKTERLAP